MKKVIVIVIATLLVVPSISLAGSASSRWDLTIGGFVKFDMGYSDKGVNPDYIRAPRDSYGSYESREAEYGSLYAASGQGRLHFIVKGPEAFGGKTTGFVEADFRGLTGGGDYGEFALRHAFMKINWANDSLLIGRFWNTWGNIGTHTGYLLSYGGLIDALKAYRNEQITWNHKLTKEWGFFLAIEGNTVQDFGRRTLDGFANSPYPFFEGGINYTSDACGKIGPFPLSFEIGGFTGWERQIWDGDSTATISFDDKLYTAWGAAIKGHIPLIPERKGNKAGALGVSGTLFIAQNLGWIDNAGSSAYRRANDADGSQNFAYPHSYGGWFQLSYWLTNNLSFHGWYSHRQNSYSSRFQWNNPAASSVVEKNQQYILNISYDVNPAMRFAIEYAHIRTKYGNYLFNAGDIIGDNNGRMNTFRIGAWYFF